MNKGANGQLQHGAEIGLGIIFSTWFACWTVLFLFCHGEPDIMDSLIVWLNK